MNPLDYSEVIKIVKIQNSKLMKKNIVLLTAVVLLGAANAQTRKTNKKAKAPEPPVTVEDLISKGIALYDSTKYEKAIMIFEKCVAMDSTCGDAYLYLSSAHWMMWFKLMNDYDYENEATQAHMDSLIDEHLKKSSSYGEAAILYTPPTDCEKKLKAYCLTRQCMQVNYYSTTYTTDYISPAIDLVEKNHLLDSCHYFMSPEILDINSTLCEFLFDLYHTASFQAERDVFNLPSEEEPDELLEKCIRINKTIIQHTDKNNPEYDINSIYLKLANYYLNLYNYDSAYTYITKVDDGYITEIGMENLYSYSAFVLYMAGRYDESSNKYIELISEKRPQAWSETQYAFNRDYADMLTEKLMKISGNFDDNDWFYMFQFLFIQNDYEKSIQINESLRKQGKNSLFTDYYAALSTMHLGNYKKAVKCFDALLKDNPDLLSVYQYKVEALNAQGKKKAAYKIANSLLTEHKYWEALTEYEFLNQNYTKVIQMFDNWLSDYFAIVEESVIEEGAVEEHPVEVIDEEMPVTIEEQDFIKIIYYRAYSYIFSGQPEKAKDDLQYLVDNANIDMQAHAYVELGRSDEALRMLNQIKGANILNPRHHRSLCVLYCRMGNTDKALWELDIALQLGFRDFYFLETDPLISSIRELPKFKELIKKYKKIPR